MLISQCMLNEEVPTTGHDEYRDVVGDAGAGGTEMRIRASLLSTALFVTYALGTATAIADPAPASGSSIETVTVTAERRPESILDVASSVKVVTGDTLKTAGVVDMHGLSTVTPGLNFTMNGTGAQPTLRGVSSEGSSAGDEQNVAIYLDGVYQPAEWTNIGNLPDVDNVQVLKGPQGTLYGRNATGGAILIATQQPQFDSESKFSISDGTYSAKGGNDVLATAFVTGSLVGDTLAGSLAASYNVSDGYVTDVFRDKTAGGVQSSYARGKLLYDPVEGVEIVLTGFYMHRFDRNVFAIYNEFPSFHVAAMGLPLPNNNYQVANNQGGFSDVEVLGSSLNASWQTSLGTLTSITAFEHENSDIIADGDESALASLMYNERKPLTTWSQEFNFVSRDFGPVNFLAGLFFYDSVEKFNPLIVQGVRGGPSFFTDFAKATGRSAAAYAEVTYKVTDQLSVIGGLRYTDESKVYDGSTTPTLARIGSKTFTDLTARASAIYKFSDTTSAYFTFNQGFKSGVFDTTAFSPIPVQPEKANSYEVGIKSAPIPDFTFSAAAYYYDIANLQLVQNNAAGLSHLSNASSATIEGIDFDSTWNPVTGLTLNGGVTYLPVARYGQFPNAAVLIPNPTGGAHNGSIDATGHRLLKAPDWQGNLGANYVTDLSWGEVALSTNLFFIGSFSYDLFNDVHQRSYALLSAQVSWSPSPSSSYSIALWGKNLTDQKTILDYLESGSGIGYAYGAPREVGISFNLKQ